MIFCQKMYKSCKSQCIIIRQQIVHKNNYEPFTDSCEQFTDGYVLLRAVYDTYGLLRVIYGKINTWTIVRRCLTRQNIWLSFHGSCELLRVVTRYLQIPASYYGCMRLIRVGDP